MLEAASALEILRVTPRLRRPAEGAAEQSDPNLKSATNTSGDEFQLITSPIQQRLLSCEVGSRETTLRVPGHIQVPGRQALIHQVSLKILNQFYVIRRLNREC